MASQSWRRRSLGCRQTFRSARFGSRPGRSRAPQSLAAALRWKSRWWPSRANPLRARSPGAELAYWPAAVRSRRPAKPPSGARPQAGGVLNKPALRPVPADLCELDEADGVAAGFDDDVAGVVVGAAEARLLPGEPGAELVEPFLELKEISPGGPPAPAQEPLQTVPGAVAGLVEGGREPVAGGSGRDVLLQLPPAVGEGLLEPQESADEPLPQPLEAVGAGAADGIVQGFVSQVLEEDEARGRIGADNLRHRTIPLLQQGQNPLLDGEQVVGPAPGEAGKRLALGDDAAAAVEVDPPDPG